MGGGQGNALTSLNYVINQDPAMKGTEMRFPTVEVRAIQDDITMRGPPEDVWGADGALTFLLSALKERGLEPNTGKFSVVGTTEDACDDKPDWLNEPKSILSKDGVLVQARGISICKNPIGEEEFVKTYLANKFVDIRSAITKSFEALLPSSPHATYLAFYYSFQARFDYWLATNNLRHTDELASSTDTYFVGILSKICDFDIALLPAEGIPRPSFIAERVSLKVRNGGIGFRRLSARYLLLNSLNNTMRQCIDRRDKLGSTILGVWPSLSSVLGAGSFDEANLNRCWEHFHMSGITFAEDHLTSIDRVKARYASNLVALRKDPPSGGVFSQNPSCFGAETKKLHSVLQEVLRQQDYEVLLLVANQDLARDDQRAITFLATHDNPFANVFPLSPTGADRTLAFSATEFRVSIGRKLGIPLRMLGGFVDQTVRASGNSRRTRVDPFGNGVAAAPGVPGDHFRKLHDHIVNVLLFLLRDAGIPCRGGPLGSCKHIFSKCFNAGSVTTDEDKQRLINGIIPDGLVDARNCSSNGPFQAPNKLMGYQTLIEHKTLASLGTSVEDRQRKINADIKKHAQELDRQNPGSTFEAELKAYGENGEYLALVTGPFANLSSDFNVLVDLIARERAFRLISQCKIAANQALAIYRQFVSRRIGLIASRGWAQHIITRFRDAVSADPTPSPVADAEFFAEADFSSNSRRGGYHGRSVPGA